MFIICYHGLYVLWHKKTWKMKKYLLCKIFKCINFCISNKKVSSRPTNNLKQINNNCMLIDADNLVTIYNLVIATV